MFTFQILIQITPTEFLLRWMWETERPVRNISLCLRGARYLVERANASEWALPCVVGTMLSVEDSREVYRPSPLPAQTGLLPLLTGGFSSLESGQALGPAVADSSGTSKVGLWKPGTFYLGHLEPWAATYEVQLLWDCFAIKRPKLVKWGDCPRVRAAWEPAAAPAMPYTGAIQMRDLVRTTPLSLVNPKHCGRSSLYHISFKSLCTSLQTSPYRSPKWEGRRQCLDIYSHVSFYLKLRR